MQYAYWPAGLIVEYFIIPLSLFFTNLKLWMY